MRPFVNVAPYRTRVGFCPGRHRRLSIRLRVRSQAVMDSVAFGSNWLVRRFAIPVWQTFFLNAPKLEVEISAIMRSLSQSATIPINDYSELEILKLFANPSPRYRLLTDDDLEERELTSGLKIERTEALLNRARQQLRDLPDQIEERRKETEKVQALSPSTFTRYECERFNQPLPDEVEFDPVNKEETLKALSERYQKRLDEVIKRYADLQAHLPTAERKIEVLRAELTDKRSFFTVSASLINSGRTNTAIKVPALLRVSIGEGNYVDIKLTLKDFENKSEISANGTSIGIFESPEISSFPEDDRRLINTYWGQSVSARLYIEDIYARAYGSNRIAFAEGLYQKIIYDRLAQVASADKSRGRV